MITLGDVAGKGSPAALLMALLLAILRTLVDEKLEPAELVTRLNVQVCRHAPGSRFITLFYAVFDPRTGSLTYVSAGHMPPLLLRGDGRCERLTEGGIALGMFEQSTYTTGHVDDSGGGSVRGVQRRDHRGRRARTGCRSTRSASKPL